jgi:hypothetical protein
VAGSLGLHLLLRLLRLRLHQLFLLLLLLLLPSPAVSVSSAAPWLCSAAGRVACAVCTTHSLLLHRLHPACSSGTATHHRHLPVKGSRRMRPIASWQMYSKYSFVRIASKPQR